MPQAVHNHTNQRFSSIDIIKGICILAVIVTHCSWQDMQRLHLLFPFWIDMAVPLFMIISGFVYANSFHKKGINVIGKAYTFDFVKDKIIRYSVPFAIAFCVEEILFSAFGIQEHTIVDMFFSFLSGGTGPGSYYYPIMIQYIFYFPIIYAIVRKFAFKGVFICGFINFIYEVLKYAYGMPENCYRLLIFRYTLLIAYGCYLATGTFKRHKKLSVASFVIGFSYIVVTIYFGIVPPITNYWPGTSLFACLYIIPLAKPIILNNLSNRIIEAIGRASYHIFLVQMVYYCGSSMIYSLVPISWLHLPINILICVVGGLAFYYVEKPISKMLLKKVASIRLHFKKTSAEQ